MSIRYPNLAAEMARNGISRDSLCKVAAESTHKTTRTAYRWLFGNHGEVPICAAMAIREELFPTMPLEYLFSETVG